MCWLLGLVTKYSDSLLNTREDYYTSLSPWVWLYDLLLILILFFKFIFLSSKTGFIETSLERCEGIERLRENSLSKVETNKQKKKDKQDMCLMGLKGKLGY